MKKVGLVILCVLLFLAAVGGGTTYMLLTPRGVLRTDSPVAVLVLEETWGDGTVIEAAKIVELG